MEHLDTQSDSEQLEKSNGQTKNRLLIAGIGASAGGIQALQTFFGQVPSASGIAYVVILHLSPDHDSQLASILQRATALPVTMIGQKTKVEPDNIYVIPPDQHLVMQDGAIAVFPNIYFEERRAPVDIFFRTLADSHGSNAVCVILSGTGANGSMGLKRVKEEGGVVFAQAPQEAAYNDMPRNAIATGLVDAILPAADIPAKIVAYRESLQHTVIPVDPLLQPDIQQEALRLIFTRISHQTGHDFSQYKQPTMLRRIERRINVHNLPSLPAYAAYVEAHPEEVHALLKDLLISVTNFFRDRKSFNTLERDILPTIFHGKSSGDVVRIWVAGCATGEEAYSLAMLCVEQKERMANPPEVQIFATDISEDAIAEARAGIYTLSDIADVSPERLSRFFEQVGEEYRVHRRIREMILFASQNFINNPPFSFIDLVTCRNALIYLNHAVQSQVLDTFYFALVPDGHLFLGNSETIDESKELFVTVSKEDHIYRKKATPQQVARQRLVVAPRHMLPPEMPFKRPALPDAQQSSFQQIHKDLREESVPPSILVNAYHDILYLSDGASRYLQMNSGEPSQNLLRLIRDELRADLRSALYQATLQQMPLRTKGFQVSIDGKAEAVNLYVRPVLSPGKAAHGTILIIFEPDADVQSGTTIIVASEQPAIQDLEDQLESLNTQLRSSSELYDYQTEELRASNEELQAMVEELRSTAEELETSREELQSINEELRTVNQELKVKLEELSISSNNLQNLINSTNIGTVFLDRTLRIVLFTPAIRNIFSLILADHGRPLSDINSTLVNVPLMQDVNTVLENLHVVEREVKTTNGQVYLMRILPYRTSDDRINGVVITFINISERKAVEQQREDFISIASHELKTPVTSIRAYTELLLELFKESNDMYSTTLMQKLHGQLERLTGLISDLFDTTQISEGKMNLRLEKFDINQLISEQVEELQRLSARHTLVYLPCDSTIVHADRERIGQVLNNLITNAIKYSPQGGEVTISCSNDKKNTVIGVKDRGVGIPESERSRIFDRFFRVRNPHLATYPGIGLGLYICAGIIHRHGGAIWVQSKEQEGSNFLFTLPLSDS